MTLAERHLRELREGSGIPLEVIEARGYRTVTKPGELRALGFADYQARAPALLVPIHAVDGSNSRYVLKPDRPRFEVRVGKPPKPVKYDYPVGQSSVLDVPTACRTLLFDPTVDLWITEGWKKGDALTGFGKTVIALGGVWNWCHRDEQGKSGVPLPDWNPILPTLDGRRVFIVFDSDAATKPEVGLAERRLAKFLRDNGAWATVVRLPGGPDGAKVGVDDFLVAHGKEALEQLAEEAALKSQVVTSDEVRALQARLRELEQQVSAQAAVLRNPGLRPTDKLVVIAAINEAGWRQSKAAETPFTVNCGRLAEATGLTRQAVGRSLDILAGPDGPFLKEVTRRVSDDGQYRSVIRLTPRSKGVVELLASVASYSPGRTHWGGRRERRCPDHPDAAVVERLICAECGQIVSERQKLQDATPETSQGSIPPITTVSQDATSESAVDRDSVSDCAGHAAAEELVVRPAIQIAHASAAKGSIWDKCEGCNAQMFGAPRCLTHNPTPEGRADAASRVAS